MISLIADLWGELNILNPTPASRDEIAAFETRYGVKLPPLVREYFLTLNGTRGGECEMEDKDLISFWHLDQVRTYAEQFPDEKVPDANHLFIFADHCNWCYGWAMYLSDDPTQCAPVSVLYEPPSPLTSSFEEFLEGYVYRNKSLLYPSFNY